MRFYKVYILMLIPFIFSMTSCEKDSSMERYLWNKGGEWNIEKLTIVYTFYEEDEITNTFTEIYKNNGLFLFKKDNNGFLYVKNMYGYVFTYSVTNNHLTLIDDDEHAHEFEMVREAEKLTLTLDEVYDYFTAHFTYELKKK